MATEGDEATTPSSTIFTYTCQLQITEIQKSYVRKVIDTLNDLDNVLWEMGNEMHRGSVEWNYHMIHCIHEYEQAKPKQHPVGMTGAPIENEDLFSSPADWISPTGEDGYKDDPPAADGITRAWRSSGSMGSPASRAMCPSTRMVRFPWTSTATACTRSCAAPPWATGSERCWTDTASPWARSEGVWPWLASCSIIRESRSSCIRRRVRCRSSATRMQWIRRRRWSATPIDITAPVEPAGMYWYAERKSGGRLDGQLWTSTDYGKTWTDQGRFFQENGTEEIRWS